MNKLKILEKLVNENIKIWLSDGNKLLKKRSFQKIDDIDHADPLTILYFSYVGNSGGGSCTSNDWKRACKFYNLDFSVNELNFFADGFDGYSFKSGLSTLEENMYILGKSISALYSDVRVYVW